MTFNNLVETCIWGEQINLLCQYSQRLGQLQCILKIIFSTTLFKNAKLNIKKKGKKRATQVFQNFGSVWKGKQTSFFFRPYISHSGETTPQTKIERVLCIISKLLMLFDKKYKHQKQNCIYILVGQTVLDLLVKTSFSTFSSITYILLPFFSLSDKLL